MEQATNDSEVRVNGTVKTITGIELVNPTGPVVEVKGTRVTVMVTVMQDGCQFTDYIHAELGTFEIL